jgi:uncharacterized protein (DUF1800 family)
MKLDSEVEVPISLSMDPYTGTWTEDQAAHLLRRTLFGPTLAQIQQAVTLGMDDAVDELLQLVPTDPPLTFSADEEVANLGETWVNSPYPAAPIQTETTRRNSFFAWLVKRVNQGDFSIQEKMCLFWQNHFSAEYTFDSRATYNYHELIRSQALGNFKQLVKDITIDPCMLVFLSGALNNQFSPNENYSRELLELYTLGKGPTIATGDYTYFKEHDILEGAKVLTGWTVQGFLSETENNTYSEFNPILHDTSTKTLSEHFDFAEITNNDDEEYSNLIDLIFDEDQVAIHICTNLYRWFVNYDITPIVETTIIPQLADTLRNNNYEMLPVMQQLLKSEHFYDMALRGTIIKNPYEFIFSILNSTYSKPDYNFAVNYEMYLTAYFGLNATGMEYAKPPTVGGWTAYYQAPSYSRLWVNSASLKLRYDLAMFLNLTQGINVNGDTWGVNHMEFLNNLSMPSSAPNVIDDMVLIFCSKGLDTIKKLTLKAILTNGLPDFEWTLQYNEYLNDPTNPATIEPVRIRVALTLDALIKMPEFQVI